MKDGLGDAFERFSLAIESFDFIPPGDQDFLYDAPRFSLGGDLLFDVNFKHPVLIRTD